MIDLSLCQHSLKGLTTMSIATFNCLSIDDFGVYVRIFLLLYEVDTVLLTESQFELQRALDTMPVYCCILDLKVNKAKEKVVIFSKRNPNNDVKYFFLQA